MEYQDYIRLGFTRTDMCDNVEFRRRGYYGYTLEKQISNSMVICATDTELDCPKLYIKRMGKESYHIIPIPCDAVHDLLGIDRTVNPLYTAC